MKLELLPLRKGGMYKTRNGKTAVVLTANPVMSDGRIIGHKRNTVWWTQSGHNAGLRLGVKQKAWDLIERVRRPRTTKQYA